MPVPTASKDPGGRPRKAALVVAVSVLAVLLGATAVLAQPRDPFPRTPATALLPADGHRETRATDVGVTIREFARSTGAPMLASGPAALSFATDDFEATITGTWLRLLETSTNAEGVSGHKTVALQISDRGIHRRMDVEGDLISRWEPAPVLLPATVEPGSTWRSSGTIQQFTLDGDFDLVPYDFAGAVSTPEDAALAEQNCLVVQRTERTGDVSAEYRETWCPGLGVVAAADLVPADSTGTADLTEDRDWDPNVWALETVDLNVAAPMSWGTGLAPVGTADVLVVGHEVTGDVNFAPDGDITRAWRAHPGGRVTALSSFGELVVATTTMSRAVAYNLQGVFQWQVDLPDVAVRRPTLVAGNVILVDGSGRVTAVDALTGKLAWSTSLSDQVISNPVPCGDLTVVGTTGSEVVVLDASGAQVGAAQMNERTSQFTCNSVGEVVAAAGSRLERILPDGTTLVSVPLRDAIISDIFTLDDTVVTFSASAITAWDDTTLERLWRIEDRFGDVEVADSHIVAIDTERIVAFDPSGREVASWPATIHAEGMPTHLVPHASGVGVLSPELTYTRLR